MLSGIRAKAGGDSKCPGLGSVSCTSAQETWPQGRPLKSSFPNQTKGAGWNPGFTELRSRSPSNLSGPGMPSDRCPCPSPSLLPLFHTENVVLPALRWRSWPACLWPVPAACWHHHGTFLHLPPWKCAKRQRHNSKRIQLSLPDIKLGSSSIEHELFSVYWTLFPCPAVPWCCNFLVIKVKKKGKICIFS